MASNTDAKVRLDLNNPTFQDHLFYLQKTDRHVAIETLKKIRQMNWAEVYRDKGLRWGKILSVKAPKEIDAIYSIRITQSRRAVAFRDGDFMRLQITSPDHDSTYGKK